MRNRGFPLSGYPKGMYDPCTKPPEGWTCSRYAHHDGPCAASPIFRYPVWDDDTREEIAAACESYVDDFYQRNGITDDAMLTSNLERLYNLVVQR